MPADYKSTGTFSQRPIANSLFRKAASVLCTLCSVLFLASCTQDEIIAPVETIVPQGMKTVTVDFMLSEDKPAFGEGETRATTDGTWAEGDELLMVVNVTGMMNGTLTRHTSYVSLKHDGTAWDVMPEKSGTALNETPDGYSYVMLTQTEDIDLSATDGIGVLVPEDMTLHESGPTIYLYYAPDMEMALTHGGDGTATGIGNRTLKAGALTTAPEAWYLESTDGWKTDQARLRVYTGQAGDVVTLRGNSYNYYPGSVPQTADGIYTATTQDDGYAYFYGVTYSDEALTSDFTVSLTGVKVGEGDAAITCPLSPVILLEASTLVPVKLDAGKSYKLDATDKRTAAADGIAIVSGSETDLDAVKAAIAGKTTVYVTGEMLAAYTESIPKTVVGQAISQLESGTTVSLVLPDATEIGEEAFRNCTALTSVSLPSATTIGQSAFYNCTALTSVSLPKATEIGADAFYYCTALTSVSAPKAISIGDRAFGICTALKSVSAPKATSIGENAFAHCTALTSLTLGTVRSVNSSSNYNSFFNASTKNCALTLGTGSTGDPVAGENKTWAGETWASITLK